MRVNAMSIAAAIAATLLALTALRPATASACSCMQQTQEDAAKAASAIFEGRVTRIDDPEGEPKVHFAVVRSFKGPNQETLIVSTANNSAACGYAFEQGKSYLVYASAEPSQSTFSTSLCSRTAEVANAGEDLNKLGLGVTPFDPGPGSEQPVPPSAPAAEPAKGGCASCAVGAASGSEQGEHRALFALTVLALGAAYRITSRRRSGSRS